MRRDFELLPEDATHLQECGYDWETLADGSQWVLLNRFDVPPGYKPDQVTAAIRLETGYPYSQLDMVYFHPALSRRDGKTLAATSAKQVIDGRTFQRWSRHRTSKNPWIPGQDSLGTHIMLVEDWLEREFNE